MSLTISDSNGKDDCTYPFCILFPPDVDASVLSPLVPVVCGVLQQSTYQLYPPSNKDTTAAESDAILDVKLKVGSQNNPILLHIAPNHLVKRKGLRRKSIFLDLCAILPS